MLTADLLIASQRSGQVYPRYLPTEGDAAQAYLEQARQLIAIFEAHAGQPRAELDQALKQRTAGRPDFKLERGLAKLLEDKSEFVGLPHEAAAAQRQRLFAAAAEARRERRFDRGSLLTAHELPADVAALDELRLSLYGDLKRNERLVGAELPDPEELLERYNLALAQAVLLRALELSVTVRWADPPRLRQLLRHVKFHGLLQEATRRDDGGVFLRLDGPLSIFSATPRYGVRMAGFLPALLLCEDWELDASVQFGRGRRRRRFRLTPHTGLKSRRRDAGAWLPELVEAFADRFAELAGPAWEVDREVPFLNLGGEVVVPDFRFRHPASGWEGCLEVLGYWRRGGVARRLKVLRAHGQGNLIVAVDRSLKLGSEGVKGLKGPVLPFRDLPSARKVLKLLEGLRAGD